MKAILRTFKQLLTYLGAILPESVLHSLQMVLNYMKLGRWNRSQGFVYPVRFPHRAQVFNVVAERIKDERVLYLEFGVYQGSSMRWWSKALRIPPRSCTGLTALRACRKHSMMPGENTRAAGSQPMDRSPRLDDPRVTFFKGWFNQTLPGYIPPDDDVLVINIDADLYSSTIFVLNSLRLHFKKGTYLYMDDMSRPDHEPRAMEEFMRETGLKFRPLAADVTLNNAFFMCEG